MSPRRGEAGPATGPAPYSNHHPGDTPKPKPWEGQHRESPQVVPWKKWPKVDPFAICDVAREYKLTANEAWTLHVLAIQAEYRSHEWVGSMTDLAGATRLGRNTVRAVLGRLDALGLIETVEPFRPAGEGRVEVIDLCRLVQAKGCKDAPDSATDHTPIRAAIAPATRSQRAANAPSGANDLGKEAVSQVSGREGGGTGARAAQDGGHRSDDLARLAAAFADEPTAEAGHDDAGTPHSDDAVDTDWDAPFDASPAAKRADAAARTAHPRTLTA